MVLMWHVLVHIREAIIRQIKYLPPPKKNTMWLTDVVLTHVYLHHIRVSCMEVKWSRYRPSVAQRVGRGIALLFHDRGTRRRWVVSSTPWPHFTPRKDPVPIVQEAGWAPKPVWTGRKSHPHQVSIPDRPAHSQSLYRLSSYVEVLHY